MSGEYRILSLDVPRIGSLAGPGQFVHVRVPHLNDAVLRRPFSVFQAESDTLAILYKTVGRGTAALAALAAGQTVGLMGPLGHGFPLDGPAERVPVLVAGGYGMAALYLVAQRLPHRGLVFVGGRSAQDILCIEDFAALGWPAHIATEDGTRGVRGRVTDVLDAWLGAGRQGRTPEFFACGPNGMLQAVGDRAQAGGWTAWLAMDRHMGCGVGACLTCVVKCKAPDGDWVWVRSCKEGPVFECRQIHWEEEPCA